MEISKVGVVGAGDMGTGIAQVCVVAGLPVYLLDVTQNEGRSGASSGSPSRWSTPSSAAG